jgi:hypothetical protein
MGGPEFEAKLDELLEDYRHVVWQSYQLPFFSIMPTLIVLWQYLIAVFGIFVDLILLPYTLVALFLRLFKVRWRIIAPFSKRLWYVLVYISRGEIYGSIVMRPVVRWLVKTHIARRLRTLGELIATSEHFPAETRARLGAKIAEAQARFPVRELNDFFKDSLVPALVLGAISFITDQVGDEEQKKVVTWVCYGVVALIGFYVISIVIAGFPTKRGLLLGREAKRAAFPGGVQGQGLYGLEREIFSIFPVRPKELSLDTSFFILTSAISPVLSLIFAGVSVAQFGQNYLATGSTTGEPVTMEEFANQQIFSALFAVATYTYIRVRRGILKRN